MSADAIGPFLRELGEVADQFNWVVCRKTGRIIGWLPGYDDPFTPIQAVQWFSEKVARKRLRIADDYEAARALGIESIAYALVECCNHKCEKAWRKAVLIEIGKDWRL